jgi:peptidylprolyl isomerase
MKLLHPCINWCKKWLSTSLVGFCALSLSLGLSGAVWNNLPDTGVLIANLPAGDAITDPEAILRYALPFENETIRKLQANIEDIDNHIRAKRWSPIVKDVKTAANTLTLRTDKILATVPDNYKAEAESLLEEMKIQVTELQTLVETKDREGILAKKQEFLKNLTKIEESMVVGYPFEVPSEYANLPQLKGRATVEMETTQGKLSIVVDGYSAPVNAGNFVDLVQRGFYKGLEFIRAEDFFILQAGDPPGAEQGFIDPKTKKYRAIPLEILVEGDELPTYKETLEDQGRYLDRPVLPFNAYGAIALARPETDPNGGSSQFFFFKYDNELTPPGFNLMDGRYSVFGYVVEGKDVLDKLGAEDKIISAKVVKGSENLVKES